MHALADHALGGFGAGHGTLSATRSESATIVGSIGTEALGVAEISRASRGRHARTSRARSARDSRSAFDASATIPARIAHGRRTFAQRCPTDRAQAIGRRPRPPASTDSRTDARMRRRRLRSRVGDASSFGDDSATGVTRCVGSATVRDAHRDRGVRAFVHDLGPAHERGVRTFPLQLRTRRRERGVRRFGHDSGHARHELRRSERSRTTPFTASRTTRSEVIRAPLRTRRSRARRSDVAATTPFTASRTKHSQRSATTARHGVIESGARRFRRLLGGTAARTRSVLMLRRPRRSRFHASRPAHRASLVARTRCRCSRSVTTCAAI